MWGNACRGVLQVNGLDTVALTIEFERQALVEDLKCKVTGSWAGQETLSRQLCPSEGGLALLKPSQRTC